MEDVIQNIRDESDSEDRRVATLQDHESMTVDLTADSPLPTGTTNQHMTSSHTLSNGTLLAQSPSTAHSTTPQSTAGSSTTEPQLNHLELANTPSSGLPHCGSSPQPPL